MPASMEQKCLKQKCFQETFRGPSPTFLFLSTWANKPFIWHHRGDGIKRKGLATNIQHLIWTSDTDRNAHPYMKETSIFNHFVVKQN